MFETDRGLWSLLVDDDRIARFSVYGLFPASYEIVYGGASEDLAVRYDGRTRGRVAIITGWRGAESIGVVIKPCQSPSEPDIARIAGETGAGPRQFPSVSGFISEEFVGGRFLTDLLAEGGSEELIRGAGRALAATLRQLHAAGICYNDATISDPDGRSHIIVEPDHGIRLIDFGVALLLNAHPTGLSFHDAYNAARTDPMFRLFRQMTPEGDTESLYRFIAEYGERLAAQSPAEIQQRDWRIAEEGISVVAQRFSPVMAAVLREGFTETR